jgi:hypothetical protein
MKHVEAPQIIFDEDFEGDLATLVPRFDVEQFARETSEADDVAPRSISGFRTSFPTLPQEVGALVNEPEQDTLLRLLGGGDRELRVQVSVTQITRHQLEPTHGYVLSLVDAGTCITDILDMSTLTRIDTLRAIEALTQLGVVA